MVAGSTKIGEAAAWAGVRQFLNTGGSTRSAEEKEKATARITRAGNMAVNGKS